MEQKGFDPHKLLRRPSVMNDLSNSSSWWTFFLVLGLTLWSIMVVTFVSERPKPDGVDFGVFLLIVMQFTSILLYRRRDSRQRHNDASSEWGCMSAQVAEFAGIIDMHSGPADEIKASFQGCGVSPSDQKRFAILLEELAVSLGLYEVQVQAPLARPASNANCEDYVFDNAPGHSAVGQDLLEPPTRNFVMQALLSLGNLFGVASPKFSGKQDNHTNDWLGTIMKLDEALYEAKKSGCFHEVTGSYLSKLLDQIVDSYHAVLRLQPGTFR
ncbi:hypothetical protein ONZ45_g5067 [Pleurotus djamor]|nr:hypothetical protein ONZ45_g5067 [Pleurotus djamor]